MWQQHVQQQHSQGSVTRAQHTPLRCLRAYCVSLKQLAVNGADLIAAGRTPGVGLGETLEYLLEQVLEHPEWNNKEILLKLAGQPDCPGREDAETGQKTE